MKYTVNTIYKTVEVEHTSGMELSSLIVNLKSLEEKYPDYTFTLVAPPVFFEQYPWNGQPLQPIWIDPNVIYPPNPYRNDWYTITCTSDTLSNELLTNYKSIN